MYGVNENPSQKSWTDSPKPYCHLYIDDAALGVPLESNPHVSSRPYVDWVRVMDELVSNGYLDLDNLIPIEEEEEEIC